MGSQSDRATSHLERGESRRFEVPIGDDLLEYVIDGAVEFGDDEVLLDHEDDLTAGSGWRADGYTVEKIVTAEEDAKLLAGTTELIVADLRRFGHDVPPGFSLDRYHTIVTTSEQHLEISRLRSFYFGIDQFPIDIGLIEARLSSLLAIQVEVMANSEIPQVFGVRMVRPGSRDSNPLHRDSWLDRLKDSITLYIPLVGSTSRSSLPLVPGSHLWPESETERTVAGTQVDGVQFSVPAVTGATRPLRPIRPNPGPGEALIFSPYLIHGGGRNFAPDQTRVSLALRFARV